MHPAKNQLDVGLSTDDPKPMVALWLHEVGLTSWTRSPFESGDNGASVLPAGASS